MIKIALIDDKDYGIKQIELLHKGEETEIDYYDSIKKFRESDKTYDIIYLDYYLDKDGILGTSVVPEVKSRAAKVIGFSCIPSRSEEIKDAGADEALTKE